MVWGIGEFEMGGQDWTQGFPWQNMKQSANIQDRWIRASADARRKGYERALKFVNERFGPYSEIGKTLVPQLMSLYSDPSTIRNRPGYKFGMEEGQDAIENSAAARGGALSGNALRAATEYAQDYGDTFYGNEIDRLLRGSQFGLGADTTYADRVADLETGKGFSDAQMWDTFSDYLNKHENAGMDIIGMWSSPGAYGMGSGMANFDQGNSSISGNNYQGSASNFGDQYGEGSGRQFMDQGGWQGDYWGSQPSGSSYAGVSGSSPKGRSSHSKPRFKSNAFNTSSKSGVAY